MLTPIYDPSKHAYGLQGIIFASWVHSLTVNMAHVSIQRLKTALSIFFQHNNGKYFRKMFTAYENNNVTHNVVIIVFICSIHFPKIFSIVMLLAYDHTPFLAMKLDGKPHRMYG